MEYRRFGATGLRMPVFSCGGMRFQQSWKDSDGVTPEGQVRLEAAVRRAVELGIVHIETARGYGTSERQLGELLPRFERKDLLIQTKVGPAKEARSFLETFEKSMSLLKLEYIDLFAIHGINNLERLEWSARKGGCLEAALELKRQGRVRHVGFSTHGGLETILAAIRDGRFEFVNLHWYYVNPFNWPAIEEAARRQMGVFIISPNDKGGKLYQPSPRLVELTAPLSPMVFNDLWCLSRPEVHTLSLGAASAADFDEHLKALPYLRDPLALRATLAPIEARLRARLEEVLGTAWVEAWYRGLPAWEQVPGQVNIFEILRLRNFALAFDMIEYGKMRYNLLGNADHWFPGNRADQVSGLDLADCLRASPFAAAIPAALQEAHGLLGAAQAKRLGSH